MENVAFLGVFEGRKKDQKRVEFSRLCRAKLKVPRLCRAKLKARRSTFLDSDFFGNPSKNGKNASKTDFFRESKRKLKILSAFRFGVTRIWEGIRVGIRAWKSPSPVWVCSHCSLYSLFFLKAEGERKREDGRVRERRDGKKSE